MTFWDKRTRFLLNRCIILGEYCVWIPCFLMQSQLRHNTGMVTSWISSICSTIWEEVNGTSSLATLYQNVYIFWWDMFFEKSINIYSQYYYLHMVYQLTSSSIINTFSFLLPKASLLYQIHRCLTSNYQFCHYSSSSLLFMNLIYLSF